MNKTLAVLLTLASTAIAAEEVSKYAENHHRVFLAPDGYYMKASYVNNTSQSGGMGGLKWGYDYLRDYMPYFGVSFNWAQGRLEGSWGDNNTKEAWGEMRGGYRLAFGDHGKFAITPFTGYGYYVLLQGNVTTQNFRYRFMYAPFGLKFDWRVASWFGLGLQGMYGIPFASKWSQANKHNGSTSYIAQAEMPFRFYLNPKRATLDLSVVPYWRQYKFNSKGDLIGQKNLIAGARLELGYNF